MIFYKHPIAHMVPFAIQWDRQVFNETVDDARDQFLDMLTRAIIIRAMRKRMGNAIGVCIGSDEVI